MSAGITSVISLGKESTWGTAVTPNKSVQVRPTGGIVAKENIQLIPGIRGQLAKNYSAIKGKIAYEGSFTFDATEDYLGYFLLSAFGQDTPTLASGETIVYSHAFASIATKVPLTIEQALAEDCRRFAGSICNSLKISSKPGQMVEAEASFLAKTFATATAITPAFTTVAAFNHTQVAIKMGTISLTEVESFELTYKNNIETIYALGNAEPSFYAANPEEVSIKVELYLDSTTLARLTSYLALTTEAFEVIITDPATIGSATHPILDIVVPKVAYTTGETKVTDKANLLTIEGEGYYDTATSKLLSATLTNLVVSY